MDAATDSPRALELDPLAGTPYRTVRRLGAGAMGEVVEAEHTALRRRVAVKLLSSRLTGVPAFVDRMRLEAQALAGVCHANVVQVHDHACTPEGVPFVVMELLRGRTLDDLARERGVLPLGEALDLMDQIAAGLGAVHAAGLVHRDLKPANVFLAEERGRTVVKLLDFGIVKLSQPDRAGSIAPLRHPTEEGHTVGTPRLMAPEQVLGQPCDARTDIYAAAVVFYILLAGHDPFHHHDTNVAILTAHCMEEPKPLSSVAPSPVPAGIDAAVRRALSKAPADRFASIGDFAAALRAGASASEHCAPRLPASTERMAPGAWSRAAARTAPLDPTLFRGGARAPSPVRPPPVFGLPPAIPAPFAPPAISRPARAVSARLFLIGAALLFCAAVLLGWRYLVSLG